MRLPMLAVALGLVSATALPAQRIEDGRVGLDRPDAGPYIDSAPRVAVAAPATTIPTRTLVVAGLIGGAVGAFGGAIAGMSVENCGSRPQDDMCGIVGGALGFLIGEAIGVPMGINWVTDAPGKLSRSIPASLGITAGSLVIPGLFVLAIPAQIWTSIRIERQGS